MSITSDSIPRTPNGSYPVAPRVASSFESASRVIAIIVVLSGLSVIFGWTFNITILKSVLPGLATMKANAALCFALSGLSLFILGGKGEGKYRLFGAISAYLVLFIGLLTLSEFAFGWDLGIDQFLFNDNSPPTAGAFSPPGRMSPASALAFVVLAV